MARYLAPLALLVLLCASAAPSAEAGRFFASPTAQFNDLVTFLGNKYPALLGAITSTGLAAPLQSAVEAGVKITILAPSDKAFGAFAPACSANLTAVLLDHVIPQRLGAVPFLVVRPGFTAPTLGADSVTKLNWLLKLGIKVGGVVKVSARVVRPNTFAKSRIVVHGINGVLGFCP